MASIDERVVSMAFENTVFEQRIAQTMSSLSKLDDSLKKVGANQSLGDIEKSANKVTLNAPMTAMDKLRAKFSLGTNATAISDIEKAGNKVTLEQPIKALDGVQSKMGQLSAGTAFSDIEKASDKVELSGITKAIDNVSGKFSVMAGAASVALGGIASNAAMKGGAFAKSFAVGPIIDGLHEYQTNLQAIQTVQANTDQPLPKINAALNQLNKYSDQTIYNFGEMAKNVGTFTAAGVDLKNSVSSIKGIANMAALSGSNSQQAASAMYQLSQAIASGKVGAQDWNSVVNAGMGGKKLQNALAQTAIAMGELGKKSVTLTGPMKKLTINGQSFRESIMAKPGEKPWLTSEALVNTLATLDGRFSKSALAAEKTSDGLRKYSDAEIEAKIQANRHALEMKNGVKYTDAQFKSLMKLSDSAFKSATQVKTLGQVFDIAKETIGSGWSASFQSIFGNLGEAKKLFTGMSNSINGFINANALARNQVLHDWKALGGRTDLIDGLKAAFQALMGIIKPIGQAFRDIFPRKTGADLAEMTKNFKDFMVSLKPSPKLVSNIRSIFGGLFAVLHIGWTVIKDVVKVFANLLGVVGKGSGGFLNFAGGVGEFLKAIDKALTKGGALTGFFNSLTSVLKVPLTFIGNIAHAFFSLFGSGDNAQQFAGKVGDGLGKVKSAVSPIDNALSKAKTAWQNFLNILRKVGDFLQPYIDKIKQAFSNISGVIADAFSSNNFSKTLDTIKTVLMAGLFLQLKKLIKGGFGVDFGGGALKKLGDTFDALTGHLETMQKNVQASILLKIAAALALLAGAAFIFSTIEPKRLAQAMGAMAVGLGQLVGAMALLSKTAGSGGFIKVPAMAAGMVLLAGAVLILAAAVKIFSTMSWEGLVKGLAGVAGSLVAIGLGMKLLGPSTLIQAAPLIAIAVAINLLAIAVKQFASLSWADLGKGLLGVAGALLAIAAGMSFFGPETLLVGPGLIAVSFAMTVLAGAIGAFGAMDMKTLAKGIGGVALALVAIAASLFLIPPTAALQGAGLIAVAAGLAMLGGALAIIGGLKVSTLVKGILGMGAALLVLGVGLAFMAGTIPGSLALLAAAAAFAILGPAMALIGNLSWGTILKALGAMALTLGVLAIVGALAATPLMALGAALIVLGLGLLAITAPIYLFAKAISLLSDTGQKGVAVFLTALTAFIAILPKIVIDFVKGLVDILKSIVDLAPQIITQLSKILDMIISFVIAKAPALAVAVGTLIGSFLTVINSQAPNIIASGIKLILTFLAGISNNIGKVTTTAASIIVKFLNGLTQNAPRIVSSGLNTMVAFLNGIANGIPRIVGKVAEMVTKFLGAVTSRIPDIIAKGYGMIAAILNGIANNIGKVVSAGTNIILKFLDGIENAIPRIVAKGLHVARVFLNNLADGMSGLADAGFKAIIRFLNGIADAIRNNHQQLLDAGKNILNAIVEGVSDAAGMAGPLIKKAITGLFGMLPHWAKKILGISSPSSVFLDIGMWTMKGFQKGLEDSKPPVKKTVESVGQGVIDNFRSIFQIHSPSQVLKDIGKQVGEGFRDGLDGSKQDIRNSFKDLREKINEELSNQRQDLKEEHKKLDDLLKQRADKLAELARLQKHPVANASEIQTATQDLKDINSQINESSRAISGYNRVISNLTMAHSNLVGGLKAQRDQLLSLSNQLNNPDNGIIKQLDDANKNLDDLIQKRKDLVKSITDQFSKLPEIDKESKDPVGDYKQKLKDQIDATKKFYETMKKLRAMGLDDVTFQSLLSQGLEGQGFADAILASGAKGIASINELDTGLADAAGKLGEFAGSTMYDTGIQAAQGIVDGLKAKQKELEAAMKVIADAIVKTIKESLGIRSPSKALAVVGKLIMDGLAKGVKDNQNGVDSSIRSAAQKAVDTAKESFGSIDMGTIMDAEPTITPILDLSKVEQDANKLGDLTNVVPITAAASFGQASSISAEQAAAQAAAEAAAQQGGPTFNFEQNNYSPESLSNIEIYRQTNNQLGTIKKALGL